MYNIVPTYQLTSKYQDAKAVRLAKLARRFDETTETTTNRVNNTKTA